MSNISTTGDFPNFDSNNWVYPTYPPCYPQVGCPLCDPRCPCCGRRLSRPRPYWGPYYEPYVTWSSGTTNDNGTYTVKVESDSDVTTCSYCENE